MDSLKNFARGTLSTGINSSATSASLTSGHGARFPSTAHYVVIWNQTDYGFDVTAAFLAGEAEIVRVTARATDALTFVRGQDGTTGVALNTSGKTYGVAQVANAALLGQLQSAEAQVAGTWAPGITVTLTDTPQRVVVSVNANGQITIAGFAAGRRATLVLVPDSTPRTLSVNQNYPGYASLIAAPTVASTPREIDIACDGSAYTDVKLAWADIA